MKAFNILPVFALVVISIAHAQFSKCSLCDVRIDREVRIPPAMSLRDFKYHYATKGVQVSEMYYAIPNPKAFEPYYNYRINYTATFDSGIIQESVVADGFTSIGNTVPECIRENIVLTPVVVDKLKKELVPTANFMRGTSTEMQMFWSSCPSKYVWTLTCRDWRYPDRECPVTKVTLGLSVPGVGRNAPNNLPWSPILKDLKQTNMLFGAEDLFWSYNFGESELCT